MLGGMRLLVLEMEALMDEQVLPLLAGRFQRAEPHSALVRTVGLGESVIAEKIEEGLAENELALAYAGYGRLHEQQGNIEQAREYLNKALEIFERLGTLIEPDKVRKELAELPGD